MRSEEQIKQYLNQVEKTIEEVNKAERMHNEPTGVPQYIIQQQNELKVKKQVLNWVLRNN